MTQLKHTILYLVTFCILFLVMSYFVFTTSYYSIICK